MYIDILLKLVVIHLNLELLMQAFIAENKKGQVALGI